MLDQTILTFTFAATVMTLTPGNDTMLIIRNTISGNKPSGFATLLGICSGLFVHGSAAALGVSVILMKSANLFAAVKLIGAAYLIWLGIQSILSAGRTMKSGDVILAPASGRTGSGRRRSYFQGLMTNVLNPKVAAFYLSFLPQFIRPGDPFAKPLLLAGIHVALGILWLSTIILMINRLRAFLARRRNKAAMEAGSGMVLIGLGARLALEKSSL